MLIQLKIGAYAGQIRDVPSSVARRMIQSDEAGIPETRPVDTHLSDKHEANMLRIFGRGLPGRASGKKR